MRMSGRTRKKTVGFTKYPFCKAPWQSRAAGHDLRALSDPALDEVLDVFLLTRICNSFRREKWQKSMVGCDGQARPRKVL
jgi:hypothetical protein